MLRAITAVSFWRILRRWGGPGLVVLGILDGSPIPTFGSLDALTIVLAARHKDIWFYYAAMSTLGAVVGAYISYRLGRQAGSAGLERKFGPAKLAKVRASFERWGFGAVFVPSLAPPPFPTALFFVGAGAVEYPQQKYLGAVTLARGLRYGGMAFVAAHYGRRILRYFRHPERYLATSIAITATVTVLAIIVSILWRRSRDRAQKAARQIADAGSGALAAKPHPSESHQAR